MSEQPHMTAMRHTSVELDDETAHVLEEWDAEQGRWVTVQTYSGRIISNPEA